jgi:chloramphenicol O-acetyltransferase type A
MRYLNQETWPRREHFERFNAYEFPHFNLCVNVDLTSFYPAVRRRNITFTLAVVYLLARAANAITEFRYRIRNGEVVEHEIVHPSFTVLANDDIFSFCSVDYTEDYASFAARASEQVAYVQEHPTVKGSVEQDDRLYMTAIPWVSFTSFMHPLSIDPVDSVPRFAWGKLFKDGEELKMPLSVQAHHALMDGIHMGKFYEEFQSYLNRPESVLEQA